MKTIRQQLIMLLEKNEMDARELSKELKIREKEVYDHLSHIDRSLKTLHQKLLIRPYRCLLCDFVFEERKRFTRPGRCPQCRQRRIESATYRIV